MSGFKNEDINIAFHSGTIRVIIAQLTRCSKQMKDDCIVSGKLLANNEDSITNRLVAVYLNAGLSAFRYEPQSMEHYDSNTDSYIGRTDIKVISRNYFVNSEAYHIIECKRIDGTSDLNKKYIADGVQRFFTPMSQPKYSSFYRENIMFGHVVRAIAIPVNADKIDKLQKSLLNGATASEFFLEQSDTQYHIYVCHYVSVSGTQIELRHLFYDFADVINK